MEGERILKELLKKKLGGLYDDTKNYIATLRRVVESKNGYTAKGCNTVEEVVSKYSGFCNKFLRCSIEILKASKDTKDIEEVMMTVNMVMTVFHMVLTAENGKFLKFTPSLDDVGKKILHITSHLLNKNLFEMSLKYINYCIAYLKMARNTDTIEGCTRKELRSVAMHMASLSWKGAQQLEQINTSKEKLKGKHEYLNGCKGVLEWRLKAVMFELESCSPSLESLVTKTIKSVSKYQMDSSSSRQCDEDIITLCESLFCLIKDRVIEQNKCSQSVNISSVYSTLDLGLHLARMCHNLKRTDKVNFFFEQLQGLPSGVVKPRKTNTADGSLISRFITCNISISKAAMLVDNIYNQNTLEESLKSDELISTKKMLDEGKRLLDILMESRSRTPFSLSTILQSLECLKLSLQSLCGFTKDRDGSSKFVLPCKIFQSVQSLLEKSGEMLQLEMESACTAKKNTIKDSSLQHQQQKLLDRMLALFSFIMKMYLHQVQVGVKEITNNSMNQMMSNCIQSSQNISTRIHSLIENSSFCLSTSELMWHGSLSFSLGMEAYKCDLFEEGAALMSIGCSDLKDWSFSAGDDYDLVHTRLKELLPKYGALVDCQRRARKYEEAFDSATSSILLFLQLNMISEFSSLSVDLHKHVHLWLKAKNDLVKHSNNDNLSDIRSRTLSNVIVDQEDILGLTGEQLACLLQEELKCYKAITRYDTALEQLSVTKQMIELYTEEEDSFNLGIAMLEHARVLHTNGNVEYIDRSPSEFCQESIEILEDLQNSVEESSLAALQDKTASAYLWKCILEHEEVMRQNASVFKDVDISEATGVEDMDHEAENQQVINLQQPFVLSLHAAVDMWTTLVETCAKKSQDGKVDVSALLNPTETSRYLQTAALLYGILNQPLNQVHALHLCAVINQAINTQDAMNEAIVAYTQAIHTLCSIHDLGHASLLLSYCGQIEENTSLEPSTLIQMLLAKSHFHLKSGKYSEGEKCLKMAFSSDFLLQKTRTSFVHMAVAHSLIVQYLQLPPTIYAFQLPQGLTHFDDHCTPLDAAVAGISKLESIAFTLFGQRLSDLDTDAYVADSDFINPDGATGVSHLLVVHNLLMFQLQCGALLAHQGMIRQAIKYLSDGLVLSRRFVLPYRVVEFVTSLSLVKSHKGQFKQAKQDLLHVAHILAPILQSDEGRMEIEQCLETPSLVDHPQACHCVCCSDPTVQSVLMDFFLTAAKYLGFVTCPKDSIKALEITERISSNAIQRMTTSLGEFANILRLGCRKVRKEEVKEVDVGKGRKKGRGKTGKAKQANQDCSSAIIQDLSKTSLAMFSTYLAKTFVQNAEILIDNNKPKKALDVIEAGVEVIKDMEKTNGGSIPLELIHIAACLYYLKGLVHLNGALDAENKGLDSIWGIPVGSSNCDECADSSTSIQNMDVQEEKPTKKGKRSTKTKDKLNNDSSCIEETAVRRGKSRSKGITMTNAPQHEEDELPKTRKGASRGGKKTKEKSKKVKQESELEQSVDMFVKALDLCCWLPQPKLFSQLCHCLTLCYGRANADKAVHYLNLSLGITLRYEAVNSSKKKIRKLFKEKDKPQILSNDMASLTSKLDAISLQGCQMPSSKIIHNLQQTRHLMLFQSHQTPLDAKSIPKEWTLCTLVSIKIPGGSTQELVISRQRSGRDPILIKVPMTNVDDADDKESHINDEVNRAVLDLAKLFQGNIQDEFTDIMQSSLDSMAISDSKEWCQTRSTLDNKLKTLVERLENSWLGIWKGALLGQHTDPQLQQTVEDVSKDLVRKLEAYVKRPIDRDLTEILVDSFPFLTGVQVREALSKITGLHPTSPDLDNAVQDYEKLASSLIPPKKRTSKEKKRDSIMNDRHPVVLILGKMVLGEVQGSVSYITKTDIQHLPWESIPILRDQQLTRMPSMHFVLAQTQKSEATGDSWLIDPSNAYYVLNPEDNLPNTQKIFQNWFESELNWAGVTGKKPSQDEYKSALLDHDLFLYLGHGSGRSFFKGDDVQRIICRATTILMGCSSAKLMVDGICEPRGMTLNYLLAGCPAIVGNLWDVTDRDIDRFTKSLLQSWLDGEKKSSILHFIKNARQACKLPYLIGASPVVYGLPVCLKE